MIKILLLVLLITSCGSVEPIKIITKPVEIPVYQPPRPSPLNLIAPHIDVVSHKNLDEFLADLEKSQGNTPTFMAMSPAGYELLAGDFQEIKRYISQLLEIVIYYEKVTKPNNWEDAEAGPRKDQLEPTETIEYIKKPSLLNRILNE